jgi:hypothetical protein
MGGWIGRSPAKLRACSPDGSPAVGFASSRLAARRANPRAWRLDHGHPVEVVAPVSLDALALRARLPELVLRPGLSVVARVAARGEGARGVLVLAGVPLAARLPDTVQAGDTLRLRVAEVGDERVVLRIESPEAAPTAPAAPPPPRVAVREPPEPRVAAQGEERAATVRVTPRRHPLDLYA